MDETIKIIAPLQWGRGTIDDSNEGMNLSIAMRFDPSLKEEVVGRIAVEKDIRGRIEASGLDIIEIEKPEDLSEELGGNEFRIRGRNLSIEEEIELVREAVPDIRIPRVLNIDDYLGHPFFPAMFYCEGKSKGEGKYLLENEAQLGRLRDFLEHEVSPAFRAFLKVKEFIVTPSDRYTSYRVIVSCTGEIMAVGLLYSGNTKSSNDLVTSDLPLSEMEGISIHSRLRYLEIPDSPYFLASKKVTSNVATGGGVIVLNPDSNSCAANEEQLEILRAHGIDEDRKLSKCIAEKAQIIGGKIGRKVGLFVGIDFMQDADGNDYYLEINGEPGMEVYLRSKNQGQGTAVDGYRMVMNEVMSGVIDQN